MSSGHNAAGSSDTDDCRPPPPPQEPCGLNAGMVFCPGRILDDLIGNALVY